MLRQSDDLVTSATMWSGEQRRVVSFPREGKRSLFVEGLPGAGKTTALMARLAAMLREGRRPYEILVLTPQRAQAERYEQAIAHINGPTRGGAEIVTYYSLARRAVALFWPLVAERAGFREPHHEPVFLTLETAQYYMWRIVDPLIRAQGYFADLPIPRARLLSQLLDNLNKSALVGFDHTDILARLKGAWTGSSDHLNRFWQAQDCATRFRLLCLEQNLLDFSLATEVYHRYLLSNDVYRRYAQARYQHLLVDNIEENVPVAHDLISWMVTWCQSAVLALDSGGGHRIFLGADAASGASLAALCSERLTLSSSFRRSKHIEAFGDAVATLLQAPDVPVVSQGDLAHAQVTAGSGETRFWIGMVRWVAEQVELLIRQGVAPQQIALVAPYVSEVMRFTMQEELAARGIAMRLLRPATQFRDDPVIRGLLALLWLAHPHWEIEIYGQPYELPRDDVALALETCLGALDPIRARHLADAAARDDRRHLRSLSGMEMETDADSLHRLWERVGFQVREPYETLRMWLETYQQGPPEAPQVMLSRLFGDLLSRPGFSFYGNRNAARSYGRLVESLDKFAAAVGTREDMTHVARDYVQLVLEGIASAEYLLDWPDERREEAVLLAPAYAYVTRDMRSEYQFWLDLGSDGWWNRPNQPLTNPYVLSRRWSPGRPWRDVEEEATRREAIGRLLTGLTTRCHRGLYLAFSELGVDGSEQRGRLQMAAVTVLARMRRYE